MKKETDSRSRFRSIVVIHVFASRALPLLRVIAHDKPERRNVSMHPGPTTRGICSASWYFLPRCRFPLIPFPLVRFTLAANTCVACLQLAVL